ncbi:hypothetical protein FHL15_006949 [Xylaria flabelliformis]|uniref:Uncharacterized protein n=1 Tax=Xylaria flabelliformis TaxID=2512241 RepID=A0A553HVV5_9PEZI|nr:hypothetical protein FHL15_006949 [Xylaria flabelliformis]
MRFTQVSLLLASVIGLSQGLALPQTSPAVESRDAATQLHKIFARDFQCNIDDKEQCTSCPKIQQSGKPHPADGKSVEARADIPMNAIGSGKWDKGDVLETHGLSVCTVLAVWDKNNWIMVHIPPAREGNAGELDATSEDLIKEYLGKMESRWNEKKWDNAEGFLLMSTYLAKNLQDDLERWYDNKGIRKTIQLYSPNGVIAGSGNLAISREAQDYPPTISFL